MGRLLDFVGKYAEKRGVSDPEHWIVKLTERLSTSSGLYVTPEMALSNATVIACVRVIAEAIASLPLQIYTRRDDGGKNVNTKHPLYPILHDSPNPWQTAFEFFEMQTGHLVLRGNAYAFIWRENSGRIKGLVPLNPARMTVDVDGDIDNPNIIYTYRHANKEAEIIPPRYIWHMKGLSSDGFSGISPIRMAAESIGLAQASEKHGAKFFRQGARPGGFVKMPGKLSEDAHTRLRESVQDAVSGDNVFKVMILEQGLDWQSVGMTNEESQFLETRQFQVEEIARFFRVPTILIGHSDKTSTYGSAEQVMLAFVTHTLRPWLVRYEKSINMNLIDGAGAKAFAEFKAAALLRGDTKSRFEAYAIARQNTWMNANEIRALENMNPIAGGDIYENPNITVKDPAAAKE